MLGRRFGRTQSNRVVVVQHPIRTKTRSPQPIRLFGPRDFSRAWEHLKRFILNGSRQSSACEKYLCISFQDLRVQSELRMWKPVFQPSCTERHSTAITSLQNRKQVRLSSSDVRYVKPALSDARTKRLEEIDSLLACRSSTGNKLFCFLAMFSCLHYIVYRFLLHCLLLSPTRRVRDAPTRRVIDAPTKLCCFSGDGVLDLWMTFPWEPLSVHMLGRYLTRTWPTRFDSEILFHSVMTME